MMNTLNQIILRKPGKYNQIWSIILYSFWNVLTRSQLLVDIAIKQIRSESLNSICSRCDVMLLKARSQAS